MSLEEAGLQICTWCEGDGVVTLGGDKPIRSSLYKEVVDTLQRAVNHSKLGNDYDWIGAAEKALLAAKEILKE